MIDDIENIIDDENTESDELCEFVGELIQEVDDLKTQVSTHSFKENN